ncbi:hypothetical protein GCM10010493_75430 [Streptomyces lavendulae subsp. grasserius]
MTESHGSGTSFRVKWAPLIWPDTLIAPHWRPGYGPRWDRTPRSPDRSPFGPLTDRCISGQQIALKGKFKAQPLSY